MTETIEFFSYRRNTNGKKYLVWCMMDRNHVGNLLLKYLQQHSSNYEDV